MCGIIGVISRHLAISEEVVEQATKRLYHRGPDQQRVWMSNNKRVALGHARLSIIDLETGDQPIANEEDNIKIVVNGEFYQFEKVQKELERLGHRLRTRSDSEIALHLYEEYGTDCLQHLRGEFAFIIWDDINKLLFAARDRFGIKPLFYTRHEDRLILASEAKAFFAMGVPARWDEDSFFQQLFLYLNQDRTLFEGIYQVPPGHYLLATENHFQIVKYWDLDYPKSGSELILPDENNYIEQLRTEIDEAIEIRLRADVPVGSFLSGGLDSSTVASMAARHCRTPIQAFTVSFDHSDYDEKSIAAETARNANINFHPLLVTQDDIATNLAAAVGHAETLGINWHGVARYLLCQKVHQYGYKVVLTGEGADELFAGYMQARQDLLVREDESRVPESLAFVQRFLGFIPSWMKKLAVGRSIFHILLSDNYISDMKNRDPFRLFLSQFDKRSQLSERKPIIQSLYLWTRSILPNYTLFAERLEMAHSIEVRVPLLDHKVFEFVKNMPISLLIRGSKEKYALREVAKPFITDTIYNRPKHPFFAPPVSLKNNNKLHQLLQDTLRGEDLASIPFFSQKSVIGLLDRLPKIDETKRASLDPILLIILSACLLRSQLHIN